jgi:uncharacterized protein (TIGR02231 family)
MKKVKHILESSVVQATVLSNKAIVLRAGKTKILPGENQIILQNLPLELVRNSVRVSGLGPEGTKIIGVELKREFLEEPKDEKIKAIRQKIEELTNEQVSIQNDITQINEHLKMLIETMHNISSEFSRGFAWRKSEVSDYDKFVKYSMEQMKSLQAQLRAKNLDLADVQKKINAARGEESQIQSRKGVDMNVICVDIESQKEGEFALSVEYAIQGASWYPVYDARVLTDEMKVEFDYYGLVNQQTGEDWKNTQITLSTAPDTPSTKLPELQPWYLYGYETPKQRFFAKTAVPSTAVMCESAPMGAPMSGAKEAMDTMLLEGQKKVVAEAQTAKVDTTGDVVVYKIEKLSDIPSENSPKKLLIGRFTLPATIEYLTIPKLLPEVFVSAKVTNDSEFMFLPGSVNLFSDSEYIGESSLENVAPTEKFNFSLGITKAIKVKRELVKREALSAGLLGGSKKIKYAYRIKVENNKKSNAKVTVKDQIPVSKNDEIKVEEVEFGEGDEPTKKTDMGIIDWRFELPPGKKKIIDFSFSVTYPAKFVIEGFED